MSRYNWMDSITTTGDLRTLSLNELNDADIRLHSGCNHLSCDWRSVIIIRNSRVIHKPKRQGLWTTRNKKKNYRSANEQIRRRSRKYYDAQRTDKLVILVTISIHTTKILEEKNLKHKNITRRNAWTNLECNPIIASPFIAWMMA